MSCSPPEVAGEFRRPEVVLFVGCWVTLKSRTLGDGKAASNGVDVARTAAGSVSPVGSPETLAAGVLDLGEGMVRKRMRGPSDVNFAEFVARTLIL